MGSTEQAQRLSRMLTSNTVIDCDVHPSFKSPKLAEKRAARLDEPYRSLVRSDMPGANSHPTGAFPMTVPGKIEALSDPVDDPEDVRSPLMDEYGIDVAIINSLIKPDIIPDPERGVQEMRAINDVMIEHFLDPSDDLYGYCSIHTRRPEAAAEELDRMGDEEQIVGVLFVDGSTEKPLGDGRYDPIYRAAEDNDLPAVYHTATGPLPHMDNFPLQPLDFEQYLPVHALVHPFAHMMTLVSLVTSGTPEKFPDLDFVFLESGLGWIPYTTYRLNREYKERRWEAPLLDRTPEEYVRDQFYFGTQPLEEPADATHLQQVVDMIGADSLLFTSDHPHYDFDHPGSVLTKYFNHLSEDDMATLLAGNASDLFGIDV